MTSRVRRGRSWGHPAGGSGRLERQVGFHLLVLSVRRPSDSRLVPW